MVETTSVRQGGRAMCSTKVDLRGLCFAVSAKLKNFLSSAAHKINRMTSLFPTAQPTIVDLPAPATHTEGDYFELVCTFTGIPAPKIHWEKKWKCVSLWRRQEDYKQYWEVTTGDQQPGTQ